MTSTAVAYWLGGAWIFAVGSVVGSFANVCIYRIPWQKSVIWPGSHCPNCLSAIAARDNVPILGWLLLGGRCRTCHEPISARYPLIEALAGVLFVCVFLADLASGDRLEMIGFARLQAADFARVFYHLLLLALLLIATFMDYDYQILPDSLTVTGMVLGLGLGALVPEVRPLPSTARTAAEGFLTGLYGLMVGGGVIWSIRIFGRLLFRKEAMGFGDVTLMAMIGSFLGWQAIPPIVFGATFLGLGHALYKVLVLLKKWITRRKSSVADREMPFGPYLSMAALALMLSWPWSWPRFLAGYYRSLGEVARFLMGWGP